MHFISLLIFAGTLSSSKTHTPYNIMKKFDRHYYRKDQVVEIIKDEYLRYTQVEYISLCEIKLDDLNIYTVRKSCVELVEELNK